MLPPSKHVLFGLKNFSKKHFQVKNLDINKSVLHIVYNPPEKHIRAPKEYKENIQK